MTRLQLDESNGTANPISAPKLNGVPKSAVLHRHLHHEFLNIERGEGNYLILESGRKIFDASGGAAVACLGHGNATVNQAMVDQIQKLSYCASTFFKTPIVEQAGRAMVDTTHGHMARAYIVGSGSEAMEAAMKLARQYFLEKETPEPARVRFISRHQSYHGTTLGSLAMGGHVTRRAKFEPMLIDKVSKVSPCYAYRGKTHGETDEAYVQRLAVQLDQEFQRVGPETVCAFVAEPVVGAALGCVPAVPGYFKAMQEVCRKHGALLILDEVMSGMGRTGTHHAWQQEGVVPDIQTVGKGLGGGYQPVAGVLIHKNVVDALENGSGVFVHGHTYQAHVVGCAAVVAVQRIIQEGNLVANVRIMGELLGKSLQARLGSHKNVGDIRGRGLFWAIEFVQDKATKAPFPAKNNVSMEISELGLTGEYSVMVYPGAGTVDGVQGDHIIIAPPYTVTSEDIEHVVLSVSRLVGDYFSR
ncbi:hypothetical protein diail_8532 [Diaporthe ilicicola]|nr:hypothetical protein diail_8532 [Diaporthe ilicicola]